MPHNERFTDAYDLCDEAHLDDFINSKWHMYIVILQILLMIPLWVAGIHTCSDHVQIRVTCNFLGANNAA
ncbi:hypothetical protein BDR04DRAFT_1093153 [Suillus decipiens]|nr:hypothetical protein BDR04DRAFT_1093153 [Suillus decipiens]